MHAEFAVSIELEYFKLFFMQQTFEMLVVVVCLLL